LGLELCPYLFLGVLAVEQADDEVLRFLEAEEAAGLGVFDHEADLSPALLAAKY
jgi:hypothetical protein